VVCVGKEARGEGGVKRGQDRRSRSRIHPLQQRPPCHLLRGFKIESLLDIFFTHFFSSFYFFLN
jgi:hypothetical protein